MSSAVVGKPPPPGKKRGTGPRKMVTPVNWESPPAREENDPFALQAGEIDPFAIKPSMMSTTTSAPSSAATTTTTSTMEEEEDDPFSTPSPSTSPLVTGGVDEAGTLGTGSSTAMTATDDGTTTTAGDGNGSSGSHVMVDEEDPFSITTGDSSTTTTSTMPMPLGKPPVDDYVVVTSPPSTTTIIEPDDPFTTTTTTATTNEVDSISDPIGMASSLLDVGASGKEAVEGGRNDGDEVLVREQEEEREKAAAALRTQVEERKRATEEQKRLYQERRNKQEMFLQGAGTFFMEATAKANQPQETGVDQSEVLLDKLHKISLHHEEVLAQEREREAAAAEARRKEAEEEEKRRQARLREEEERRLLEEEKRRRDMRRLEEEKMAREWEEALKAHERQQEERRRREQEEEQERQRQEEERLRREELERQRQAEEEQQRLLALQQRQQQEREAKEKEEEEARAQMKMSSSQWPSRDEEEGDDVVVLGQPQPCGPPASTKPAATTEPQPSKPISTSNTASRSSSAVKTGDDFYANSRRLFNRDRDSYDTIIVSMRKGTTAVEAPPGPVSTKDADKSPTTRPTSDATVTAPRPQPQPLATRYPYGRYEPPPSSTSRTAQPLPPPPAASSNRVTTNDRATGTAPCKGYPVPPRDPTGRPPATNSTPAPSASEPYDTTRRPATTTTERGTYHDHRSSYPADRQGNVYEAQKYPNSDYYPPSFYPEDRYNRIPPAPEYMGAHHSQQDLIRKSRGAMAYAFGGVFLFTMYGVTEATDSVTGQPYTDYILQCQWGPSLDNVKPWVVARRYREFYAVDVVLRETFPDLEHKLHRLPPKEFFSSLSPSVVYRRQQAFEIYLSNIVMNLPVILRCQHIDSFLSITQRVDKIREELGLASLTCTKSNKSKDGCPAVVYAVDLHAFSSEEAQHMYEMQRPRRLNGRGLEEVEECIRELRVFLRRLDPGGDFLRNGYLQDLIQKVSSLWPRLKALCHEVDWESDDPYAAAMIPQALQCDEDLSRLVEEYRNLIALQYGTMNKRR